MEVVSEPSGSGDPNVNQLLRGLTDSVLRRICNGFQARYSRAVFLGVFPRNCLPNLPPQEMQPGVWDGRVYFLIANTDSDNLPGRHWIAMWIGPGGIATGGRRIGEYFDPLGLPPLSTFAHWLTTQCGGGVNWSYTRFAVQHPITSHCGAFVLFYLHYKLDTGAALMRFLDFALSGHPTSPVSFDQAYKSLRIFLRRFALPILKGG